MKRLFIFLIILVIFPMLTGCALFPSKLHGVERLLVVQAMGVDAADGAVRLRPLCGDFCGLCAACGA